MDETRTIEAIMRQETTPREAREEVLSFLRDCSVEGDLDSLGLTELIYVMVVARQRLHGLLAERGEGQGEGEGHDQMRDELAGLNDCLDTDLRDYGGFGRESVRQRIKAELDCLTLKLVGCRMLIALLDVHRGEPCP
eukprot:320636-Prorocentrum_lima.AAC.1